MSCLKCVISSAPLQQHSLLAHLARAMNISFLEKSHLLFFWKPFNANLNNNKHDKSFGKQAWKRSTNGRSSLLQIFYIFFFSRIIFSRIFPELLTKTSSLFFFSFLSPSVLLLIRSWCRRRFSIFLPIFSTTFACIAWQSDCCRCWTISPLNFFVLTSECVWSLNVIYGWSVIFFLSQKQDSFLKPLVDQYAKEGKDKKVAFEANFSKPNCKPKWFFRKDVSVLRFKK